jgi:Tfp pilus assembly protein PilO
MNINIDEKKRKILIIGLIGVVLLISDIFLVVLPLVRKSFSLKAQIVSIGKDMSSLDQQIHMLDTTNKKLQALKTERDSYERSLPKEEEIPALVGNLSAIAGKVGVDIIAVKPVRIESREGPGQEAVIFHEVPLEIFAKGGYHQMGKFINELETSGKYIEVKDMEITRDELMPRKHFSRILIATYILRE